jgi:signal transduction histidine kinase
MENARKSIAEKREDTDVSLNAERSRAHSLAEWEARTRRLADDLVERDRIVVDAQLRKLLSNTLKFTPKGGLVSLNPERRADSIELAVKDTGAGIAAQELPRVFNRFWQGSSEPGTGLGLGLYICERIVSAHAGRIWVESELGRGTTFRFMLPTSSR